MTPMKAEQAIELSKAYVEASNAHDLNRIEAMLDAKAHYYSSAVGKHEGRAAIRQMMEGFFAAFHRLWTDLSHRSGRRLMP